MTTTAAAATWAGIRTVIPYLTVRPAVELIDFVKGPPARRSCCVPPAPRAACTPKF